MYEPSQKAIEVCAVADRIVEAAVAGDAEAFEHELEYFNGASLNVLLAATERWTSYLLDLHGARGPIVVEMQYPDGNLPPDDLHIQLVADTIRLASVEDVEALKDLWTNAPVEELVKASMTILYDLKETLIERGIAGNN